ncbi:MAG: hypothetical protein MN733_08005 [Nitrososphaera sp.]|nr:hypothetical protein [Nitrososphaera sp.]
MSFYRKRNSWVRRRWLDFRQGHSIYLALVIMFANFITIQYSLMIERVPAFSSLFSSLWVFVVVFLSLYVPVAILIGYWHRKSQWKVEQEAMFSENIVQARMYLFLINLIEGRASDEERRDMRALLEKIIKKAPRQSETSEAS